MFPYYVINERDQKISRSLFVLLTLLFWMWNRHAKTSFKLTLTVGLHYTGELWQMCCLALSLHKHLQRLSSPHTGGFF